MYCKCVPVLASNTTNKFIEFCKFHPALNYIFIDACDENSKMFVKLNKLMNIYVELIHREQTLT